MMLKSNQYLGHLKIDAHENSYLIGCFFLFLFIEKVFLEFHKSKGGICYTFKC